MRMEDIVQNRRKSSTAKSTTALEVENQIKEDFGWNLKLKR